MRFAMVVLSLWGGVCAAGADDKPASAADAAKTFAYIRDGAKIVQSRPITIDGKAAESLTTTTMRRVKEVGKGTLFAFDRAAGSGQPAATTYVLVAPSGLYVSDEAGGQKEESLAMPADLKVGTKWSVRPAAGGVETTSVVVAEEDVTVPAGKFRAFRITRKSGPVDTTLWFSPAAGFVKTETTANGQTTTAVVKEFVAGK